MTTTPNYQPGDVVHVRADVVATYNGTPAVRIRRGNGVYMLPVLPRHLEIVHHEPHPIQVGDRVAATFVDGVVVALHGERAWVSADNGADFLSCTTYLTRIPAKDGDGWIEWSGGECPVALDTNVDIRFHDGKTIDGQAGWFRWYHAGDDGDIVAYRVLS